MSAEEVDSIPLVYGPRRTMLEGMLSTSISQPLKKAEVSS